MKVTEIGAYEAKTHLSKILAKVQRGRTFYITRRGRRLAELRPAPADGGRPAFGSDRGRVVVASTFDDPIPGMDGYSR
jgi:antitoxin (DNA-binding transcriptional repressor) of toxin-antitoxin stability system